MRQKLMFFLNQWAFREEQRRIWGFQPSHTGILSAYPTKEQLDGASTGDADTSMDVRIHTQKHTPTHLFFLSSLTHLWFGSWSLHTHRLVHALYTHTGPTGQLGSHADMVMRGETELIWNPPIPLSLSPSLFFFFFPCPFSSHNPIQKRPSQAVCR